MSTFGQWLAIVANFAVVGGLLFLAVQVRMASRVALRENQTDLLALGHGVHDWKRDPGFAALLVKAHGADAELTESEKLQFSTYAFQLFNVWEHAFGTYKQGMMTRSYWEAWDSAFGPLLSMPAYQEVWGNAKPLYDANFQKHAEQYTEASPS